MATVLVTGANRGIGLEYCRQLQARGDQVIAVCREPSAELEALGVRIEAGLDLAAASAPAGLVARLQGQPLDVVILNAGILQSMGLEDLDPEGMHAMQAPSVQGFPRLREEEEIARLVLEVRIERRDLTRRQRAVVHALGAQQCSRKGS